MGAESHAFTALTGCNVGIARTHPPFTHPATCSEHASRMSAMENSSKSAGEILNKLTLQYNRDRQVSEGRRRLLVCLGLRARASLPMAVVRFP